MARIIAIGTVPLHRRKTTPKFLENKKQQRGTHITNWLYYIGINLTQNGKRVEGGKKKKKKKKVIRHNGLFICVTIDNQRRNGQGLIGSPRLMPVRSALWLETADRWCAGKGPKNKKRGADLGHKPNQNLTTTTQPPEKGKEISDCRAVSCVCMLPCH